MTAMVQISFGSLGAKAQTVQINYQINWTSAVTQIGLKKPAPKGKLHLTWDLLGLFHLKNKGGSRQKFFAPLPPPEFNFPGAPPPGI